MRLSPLYAELTTGDATTRLAADATGPHLVVTDRGIAGWLSSPPAKVGMTERGQGHGAFPVADDQVLYSARTVTVPLHALGGSRDEVIALLERLSESLERSDARLRVVDAMSDTYACGHAALEVGSDWRETSADATLTLVCPDPRRYGTTPHKGVMEPPSAAGTGGLTYDSGTLRWPLDWGPQAASRSLCTVANGGTATAYPTISVSGSMPGGFVLNDLSTGGQLAYTQPVAWQPVVLDCLSRTASVAGVDVTRHLTSRQFPSIAPGGSMTLSLVAAGAGAASVEARDTYI